MRLLVAWLRRHTVSVTCTVILPLSVQSIEIQKNPVPATKKAKKDQAEAKADPLFQLEGITKLSLICTGTCTGYWIMWHFICGVFGRIPK
jgi:hypothetical protein